MELFYYGSNKEYKKPWKIILWRWNWYYTVHTYINMPIHTRSIEKFLRKGTEWHWKKGKARRMKEKKRTMNFSMLSRWDSKCERRKKDPTSWLCNAHTNILKRKTDIHSYYGIKWKLFIAANTQKNSPT